MSDEDLFYKDVEGRMEELKQKPIKKEKETRGEKISKTFSLLLGLYSIVFKKQPCPLSADSGL